MGAEKKLLLLHLPPLSRAGTVTAEAPLLLTRVFECHWSCRGHPRHLCQRLLTPAKQFWQELNAKSLLGMTQRWI